MRRTILSRMTFAGEGPMRPPVRFKPLAPSMIPIKLSDDYTPFPLPLYDTDLGFGPLRVDNVPDVEIAAKKMQERRGAESSRRTTTDEVEVRDGDLDESGLGRFTVDLMDVDPTANANGEEPGLTKRDEEENRVATSLDHTEEDAMQAYVQDPYGYPLVDRLQCVMPLGKLIHRLETRASDTEFAATLADITSQLPSYSASELIEAISAIHGMFDPRRGMKAFHRAHLRIRWLGRTFDAVNAEMLDAVLNFVTGVEQLLCEEEADMLVRYPGVVVEMLHFLATIHIFKPVEWYTVREVGDSRNGDYCHPAFNVGSKTAHKTPAWELFDILCVTIVENRGEFLSRATPEELVEMFAGIAAVLSAEYIPSDVARAILNQFLSHFSSNEQTSEAIKSHRDKLLCRMFFIAHLVYMSNIPKPLLDLVKGAKTLTAEYFAAASQISPYDESIVDQWATAMSNAAARGQDDEAAGLLESGMQVIMRMKRVPEAVQLVVNRDIDARTLALIPQAMPYLSTSLQTAALANNKIESTELMMANDAKHVTKEWSPRTLLASMRQLQSLDTIFVFHSSIVVNNNQGKSTGGTPSVSAQLVQVLRACRSGTVALIVMASSLHALHTRLLTCKVPAERDALDNALLTLVNEIYHQRVVFVPFSEELQMREAGTFFDEDSLVWSLGIRITAKLPKPKCRALMDPHCKAALATRYFRKTGTHPAQMDHAGQSLAFYTAGKVDGVAHSPAALRAFRPLKKHHPSVRDPVFTDHVNPKKRRFLFRPDIGIMDKYRVLNRHLRPGFANGRSDHDLRGLGIHTPDHPQPQFAK